MGKPPDDWAIPLMEGDELQSWKELAERLRVALRKVFAAKNLRRPIDRIMRVIRFVRRWHSPSMAAPFRWLTGSATGTNS